MTHFLFKAFFVDSTDLLQKDHGILLKSDLACVYVYVGRQTSLAHFACDRGGDDGGTVFVAHVILNNENGAQTALLTSHDRTEIRIINVSASDIHDGFIPFLSISSAVYRIYGIIITRNGGY